MLKAALLTTAKKQKQPKSPSNDKWIKQFIYKMEYSAIKRNELLICAIN